MKRGSLLGKIILIEDTKILSLKIKSILLQIGFKEVDAIEPSKILRGNSIYFFKDTDIILLDLDYKNIDVTELIKKLKQIKETSKIPIISFSESADILNIKKAMALGCHDFILKPFEIKTIIDKVLKAAPAGKAIDWKQNNISTEHLVNSTAIENDVFLVEGDDTLKWTDDFKIGIKEIDDEHKKIIDQYSALYQMMKEGKGKEYYKEVLDFLYEYVNTHFAHEESFQQQIGYDKFKEHKIIHDKFKEQVFEMINSQNNQQVTNVELIRMNLFIKGWLINHILITDKKFTSFLHDSWQTG